MLYVVIFFLWMSLLIYLLMGGADYGAGILELFTTRRQQPQVRKTANHVMGPIWEANHMWLIIAVVILFVGFPGVYTTMSLHLHIPLLIMLFGIIARGASFAFRNYDAVNDGWQQVYNKIFVYSSFLTPFFLGVIAGSAVSRQIDTDASSFTGAFIFSWLNWFSAATGFFTVAVCGFLAAIFLLGEVEGKDMKKRYMQKALIMNIAMILFVIMAFIAAYIENIPLASWVFGNTISLIAVISTIISAAILWVMIRKDKVILMRLLAGLMVTALLIAVTYIHYPNIILLKNGASLSLLDQQSSPKTIRVLGIALLGGSVLILPALFYLVYSFDLKDKEGSAGY